MIGAVARIPAYWLMHAFGRPLADPINVTISTTFRCNSRCLTCNVYERPVDELSPAEWDRVFEALGRAPRWFTFSGGEPFLRKDLVEIIQSAVRRCRPEVVNIPTNGTYTERVVDGVTRLCSSIGRTQLVVNVSLDAIGARNDVIRGLRGDFEKATETFHALKALRLPNLTVGLHSVVSRHNVAALPEIADALMAMEPDQYIAEPAEERIELQTIGTGITPQAEQLDVALGHVERRLAARGNDRLSRLTRAIRLVYYRLARETVRRNEQTIPCYAAIASVHIAANGDVWGCCTRANPLGNLRTSGFDFASIWKSEEARRERRSIKAKECACPLANAAYTSILMNPRSLLRVGRHLVMPSGGSAR